MKKILIFCLLICLSANSQTKSTLYLDYYVILSPSLFQYVNDNIIKKLSNDDICTISASETKKGTYVCISASEEKQLNKEEIIGYLLVSNHIFLIYNKRNIPRLFHTKNPILKYEYMQTEELPSIDDSVKEWWFLFENNKYHLIDEIINW